MKDVFPIVPAGAGPLWVLAAVVGLLIFLAGLMGWFAWSSRHAAVEVDADSLRVAGALYGRTIPLSSLRLNEAGVVDTKRGPHRLALRTNGAGLPGYQAGWFRTAGGEKALAFVTERSRVARIPTVDGYALMVSVADPEALLEALRRRAR